MSELMDFQKAKDQFFAQDPHSPLLPEQRQHFQGLDYFPENPDLRFVLKVDEFSEEDKEVIDIITSTGDLSPHIRWGTLTFAVDGEKATLTVYKGMSQETFFLPFADTTCGKESYGAGRYLDVVPSGPDSFLIDFNYAYNPYCAYNPHWSCPIPPADNRLKLPIRAGEKKFPGAVEH